MKNVGEKCVTDKKTAKLETKPSNILGEMVISPSNKIYWQNVYFFMIVADTVICNLSDSPNHMYMKRYIDK